MYAFATEMNVKIIRNGEKCIRSVINIEVQSGEDVKFYQIVRWIFIHFYHWEF